jgi:small redox-active disulfide protein 2
MKGADNMIIKVLGPGCANCKKLEENVKEAVKQLGIEATVEKVTDFKDILSYGVMKTPGIVVDEQLKASGRVLTVEEIKKYL